MKEKITFTFAFTVDEYPYSFNVIAADRAEAIAKLALHMETMLTEVKKELA